jgi:uncharacterized protein (DUF302 family)
MSLRLLCLTLLLLTAPTAGADEMLMVRVEKPFPEAMNALQQAIREHGYQVARVQRVDIGLTSSGYKTAEYRVVFFGKRDELLRLPDKHPELLAYLPLKFTIFAEGEHTLVATNSPALFGVFFRDAGLARTFQHWEKDVRSILDQMIH